MTKLLAVMAVLFLAVGCQILVMMVGWGVKPQNWWVIIGVGVFVSTAVAALMQHVMKSVD